MFLIFTTDDMHVAIALRDIGKVEIRRAESGESHVSIQMRDDSGFCPPRVWLTDDETARRILDQLEISS